MTKKKSNNIIVDKDIIKIKIKIEEVFSLEALLKSPYSDSFRANYVHPLGYNAEFIIIDNFKKKLIQRMLKLNLKTINDYDVFLEKEIKNILVNDSLVGFFKYFEIDIKLMDIFTFDNMILQNIIDLVYCKLCELSAFIFFKIKRKRKEKGVKKC